ncbi:MAG: T9SS type A sorting domain-containing protein, partial [Candidatus Eisenbacteria bacterium]|nr:T9SS type A sorting domain-containing protein [Candidatus Eisenbacteria bacterium]
TRTSGATLSVDPVFTPRFELRPAFPNPVRGQMPRVLLVLDSSAPAQLEVWDVSGRRIAAREVGRLGAGQHLLNVTEDTILAPGLYLVSLRQGGATRVTRVVVL